MPLLQVTASAIQAGHEGIHAYNLYKPGGWLATSGV